MLWDSRQVTPIAFKFGYCANTLAVSPSYWTIQMAEMDVNVCLNPECHLNVFFISNSAVGWFTSSGMTSVAGFPHCYGFLR